MKICTFDLKGNECWTNPPTRDIGEVWAFIERIFKGTYIKAFVFSDEMVFNAKQQLVEENFYYNPKKTLVQLDLF